MDREMREYLDGVIGVVDANSYESLCLWREYHEERKVPWVATGRGFLETVGHLADMPVTLSLHTATVDGHKLLFIDYPSKVVDRRLIDAWLSENMPRSAFRDFAPVRVNRTDAMNFHNVFPQRNSVAA